MRVRVAPMGERETVVNVESGTTVQAILDIAGADVNGRSIRVNNVDAYETTPVTGEDVIITLANKMKAGA